jgi:hypothetical protein
VVGTPGFEVITLASLCSFVSATQNMSQTSEESSASSLPPTPPLDKGKGKPVPRIGAGGQVWNSIGYDRTPKFVQLAWLPGRAERDCDTR